MPHRPTCFSMILCAVIGTPADAWEKQWNEAPAIEDSCLTYDARYSEAPLFRVAARNNNKSQNEKVYFFSRKIACTQASSCPARMKAYLVDGDVVFGGPQDKNFRCVYYGTAKGTIVAGFVAADNLAPFAEDENLTQDFLVGVWTYDGNPQIAITAAGNDQCRPRGRRHGQVSVHKHAIPAASVPWPPRREKRSRFAKATTRIAARSIFCAAGRTWSRKTIPIAAA